MDRLSLGLAIGLFGFMIWCFFLVKKIGRREAEGEYLKESLEQEKIQRKAYDDKLKEIDQKIAPLNPDSISASDASRVLSGTPRIDS